jgi:hypothetical protein
MRLAPHLPRLKGYDVEDDAVGGEEHVEVALEVLLRELVGEVAYVEPVKHMSELKSARRGECIRTSCLE